MRLLTKSGGILGPIATVLGYVMSGIFAVLVAMNIPNIGLSIVLFTIVIYMVMLPLTYRQQKFSRMTPLMNPELTAIREKYKGKNDQATMQRMNEETKQVYAKYGVNPAGSCVQLVVQMLILFPLYRVIMNVPAYVSQVRAVFEELASKLLTTPGAEKYLQEIGPSIQATTISKEFTANTIIDTLYKFRPDNWTALAQKFPDLGDIISSTEKVIGRMNNFLGMNIANTPMNYIKEHATVWLVIGAILVPVLAALTQWLSVKVSMAGNTQPEGSDQMAGTMKMMNNIMPLMSAFFCLTLPVGMGIYWIMSAVVRTVQTWFINKHLEKVDMSELLKQNMEKNKKKMEKKGGVTATQISQNAAINTRNIENQTQPESRLERAKKLSKEAGNISDDAVQSKKEYRPGSLAEKANMVSAYNEAHRKK
jgi:YidC/Oxa1 family membrane protein insertase